MSNVRTRIGGLLAIGCVVALMVAGATPAFAHHKEDHAQGQGRNNADSQTTTTSESQTTTASSDDGTADGAGKNYDREGDPRGETDISCPNDKRDVNDGEVYDNTCDGRAGKAGSGSGSASGRPCAGCVGNADDKNPRGQMNDGDHDGNAGYECDGNNGVARDNPAHTGCPEPPSGSSTPMCPTMPTLPLNHPDCDDVEGRIDTSNPRPQVLPKVVTNVAPERERGAVLPFTGTGNALSLIGAALVLINSGTLVLMSGRKK